DVVDEFRGLLEAHRDAGSVLARRLLAKKATLGGDIWLIEPIDAAVPETIASAAATAIPTSTEAVAVNA
ncbi:MAG: hypothetical protein QOH61_1078, partial [Chloroflexota bacterium]|nr:hypothetical protein [Chloroflexota bacterium]